MKLIPETYFGEMVVHKSLHHFHLSLTAYRDKKELPHHRHENPYLSINLGCTYQEITKNRKRSVQTGEVIIRPAFYGHKNRFEGETGVCFNLEVKNQFSEQWLSLFNDFKITSSPLELYELFVALLNGYRNDELECLIQETLYQSINIKPISDRPEWNQKVINRIRDEYSSSFSLACLAKTARIHPVYLARKFRQINGCTVGEYIRKVRLEKAFELLMSDNKTLTEISCLTGFYDQPHFSRSFRNIFQFTPLKFRKMFKRLI